MRPVFKMSVFRVASTWGHPQPEAILPSLTPLVFERSFAYSNFVVVPKQSSPNSLPAASRRQVVCRLSGAATTAAVVLRRSCRANTSRVRPVAAPREGSLCVFARPRLPSAGRRSCVFQLDVIWLLEIRESNPLAGAQSIRSD